MFGRSILLLSLLVGLLQTGVLAAGGDGLIEALKKPGKPVLDQAGLLSGKTEQHLNAILNQLEAETGAALVVVTLPSMEGGQIDDFTNRLFEKWGVGQTGKDNGVMLLVAVQERKMRIEVGYGLEAVIPDGLAGQVRDTYVLAHFKQGQMEQGVEAGALRLAELIAEHYGTRINAEAQKPKRVTPQGDDDFWSGWGLVLFLAIYIISILMKNSDHDDWRGGSYGRRRHYSGGWYGGGGRSSGGSFGGGGGFGGFGGGMSGGGGASGGW